MLRFFRAGLGGGASPACQHQGDAHGTAATPPACHVFGEPGPDFVAINSR